MIRTDGRATALFDAVVRMLRAARVPEPRREAARLWHAVTGSPLVDRAADPGPEQARRIEAAAARRARGEPLAYATGTQGFRYLDLQVGPGVLIPRPETEGLVQLVLDWAATRWDRGLSVLELGVGSGAVILSLAHEGRFRELVGVERSAAALEAARRNLAVLAPAPPVTLVAGSWFAPVPTGRPFDVIVSNPPYLTADEVAGGDPAVTGYEPHEALDGGRDGLEPTRVICGGAADRLAPDGLLALEIDARRARETAEVARAAGFAEARVVPDLFGRDRYLFATTGYER